MKNNYNNNELIKWARKGDIRKVIHYRQNGADINYKDCAALTLAAQFGYVDIVTSLITLLQI